MISKNVKPNKSLKQILLILSSLFVVMIGYGILIPILPFYTEKIVQAEGIPLRLVTFHVGLLTIIYPIIQLATVVVWGHLSDVIGRKPIILIGLSGFILMQVLTGFSGNLIMLYLVRIIGAILSSPLIPVCNAYLADLTSEKDRTKVMGWSGGALSAGIVVGPAIAGFLAENDINFALFGRQVELEQFSIPFLFSAVLGVVVFVLTLCGLYRIENIQERASVAMFPLVSLKRLRLIWIPLTLSFLLQFGLTAFEGSFALFAKETLTYSPKFIGQGFFICGLIMAIIQPLISAKPQQGINKYKTLGGFMLSGIGLIILTFLRTKFLILVFIAIFALGVGIVIPSLISVISMLDKNEKGLNISLQTAFNNVGQIVGPIVGLWLFTKNTSYPFASIGVMLFLTGIVVLFLYKN